MPMENSALTMSRTQKDTTTFVVSLRLKGAEVARFLRIEEQALARNKYIDRTVIMRELVGLNPPDALTKDEIAHFRGSAISAKPAVLSLDKPPEKYNEKRKTG